MKIININMYFDTKKKEFQKNGKLSILKSKSIKMNYPGNVHRNDNDIFELKKRADQMKQKMSKEDLVEKKLRETSPYVNGKKNSKFNPPHIKSNVVLGDEKSRTINVVSSASKHFKTIENGATVQNGLSKAISSKQDKVAEKVVCKTTTNQSNNINKSYRETVKTKSTNLDSVARSKSSMDSQDNKLVPNGISDPEEKKLILKNPVMNKTIHVTNRHQSKSPINQNRSDLVGSALGEEKPIKKKDESNKNLIITNVKQDQKKSRNVVNKLFKPPPGKSANYVEVFGKSEHKSISPDKKAANIFNTNASQESTIRAHSFNIITGQEEVRNRSQNNTLNQDGDTIHEKTESIMKAKIESQIKIREDIAKKISDSIVDEREKSKEKFTEKILSQTFEIKDVKYDKIKTRINNNIRDILKGKGERYKTISVEVKQKYAENFDNHTIEEEYTDKGRGISVIEKGSRNKPEVPTSKTIAKPSNSRPSVVQEEKARKLKEEFLKTNQSLIELKRQKEETTKIKSKKEEMKTVSKLKQELTKEENSNIAKKTTQQKVLKEELKKQIDEKKRNLIKKK